MSSTLVCDLQRFSVHDGPGIRTTVFFKGCPLRCRWCQNPETLKFENELIWSPERCIACGDCARACPLHIIRHDHGPHIDWPRCDACFICTEACPARALEPAGREYTAPELVREVLRDREFYEPEGGVTLSGGEPMARPEFLRELLPLLKSENLHVTLETCGHFNWAGVETILSMIDLVLYDLKAADPELHRRLTGQDNRLILDNLRRLSEAKIPHQIRMPLIPGINDSEAELKQVAQFLLDLGETEIVLLPYHRLGESKLQKLHTQLKPLGIAPMSEAQLHERANLLIAMGIEVKRT
jgi:pyruvate formate lyase activating enzyme